MRRRPLGQADIARGGQSHDAEGGGQWRGNAGAGEPSSAADAGVPHDVRDLVEGIPRDPPLSFSPDPGWASVPLMAVSGSLVPVVAARGHEGTVAELRVAKWATLQGASMHVVDGMAVLVMGGGSKVVIGSRGDAGAEEEEAVEVSRGRMDRSASNCRR